MNPGGVDSRRSSGANNATSKGAGMPETIFFRNGPNANEPTPDGLLEEGVPA